MHAFFGSNVTCGLTHSCLLRVPIVLCKILGNTTVKYRWFAFAYLIVMFLCLPAFVMLISLNDTLFVVVITPAVIILLLIVTLNVLQRNKIAKKYLPEVLKDWEWLPRPLHDLGFWDRYAKSSAQSQCNQVAPLFSASSRAALASRGTSA